MPDYRLYSFGRAGRITLADWIEADSDEDAIEKARIKRQGARSAQSGSVAGW